MDDSTPSSTSQTLREIARKLFWWQSPAESLDDRIRFVCQVMTLGSWRDVLAVREQFGDELFQKALRRAPAGIFDARSWNYWHLVFNMTPVPPLPTRTFL